MKLFYLKQEVNNDYDTYSDCVVCAIDEKDAKTIRPDGRPAKETEEDYDTWAPIQFVTVEYIGEAKEGLERGVVCASFHAG